MTDKTPFPIIEPIKKGGLSLWLNRQALIPLFFLPVIASFLSLTGIRFFDDQGASSFVLALIQLPADFIIGLLCALIILIVMNAPKKDEKSGPMMFTLNLGEHKTLLTGGAIAHALVNYLVFGITGYLAEFLPDIKEDAQAEQAISGDMMIGFIVLVVIGFYCLRAHLLPILIVAQIDIKSFYTRFKHFQLSVFTFAISMITTFALMLPIMFPLTILEAIKDNDDMATQPFTPINFAHDLLSAVTVVLAYIWFYASAAYGIRTIMKKDS